MQQNNFCINCKHIQSFNILDRFFGSKIAYAKCNNPAFEKRHPVTGKSDPVYCSVARDFSTYCGKEGKLFEAKL
jgi:hypothetical protein